MPRAKSAAPPAVSAAVLNDLGQLRWITTTPSPLTPLEAEGRTLYVQSRCAFCHSQYAEPASSDARRWGPPVQSGEYAFDQPVQFGLRGPAPAYRVPVPEDGGALVATSLTTVIQMVASGYGVTLLPEVAVDVEIRDDRLKLLRFASRSRSATSG